MRRNGVRSEVWRTSVAMLDDNRSGCNFDLRFIPDEMSFDDEPKCARGCAPSLVLICLRDSANSVPADYEAPVFATPALSQSKVELTWDNDDPRRSAASIV